MIILNKIILKMNEKWYNLIKQKLIFTKEETYEY